MHRRADEPDQRQVEAPARPVGVHGVEQDLAGAQVGCPGRPSRTTYDVVRRTAEQVFIRDVGGESRTVEARRAARRVRQVGVNTAAIARPNCCANRASVRQAGARALADARRVPPAKPDAKCALEVTRTAAGGTARTPSTWRPGQPTWAPARSLLNSMDADGRAGLRPAADPARPRGGACCRSSPRRSGCRRALPAGCHAGADAVLAASVFHFGDLTIGAVKQALAYRRSDGPVALGAHAGGGLVGIRTGRARPDEEPDVRRRGPRHTATVVGAIAAGVAPAPFLVTYSVVFILHGTVFPVDPPPDITTTHGGEALAGLVRAAVPRCHRHRARLFLSGRSRWPFLVGQWPRSARRSTSSSTRHRASRGAVILALASATAVVLGCLPASWKWCPIRPGGPTVPQRTRSPMSSRNPAAWSAPGPKAGRSTRIRAAPTVRARRTAHSLLTGNSQDKPRRAAQAGHSPPSDAFKE